MVVRPTATFVSEESDIETIAAALEDECARCILVRAYNRPMSARDLAEQCDVSEPTVYRRLESLRTQDLVVERTQPDERGHHYKEYRTNVDQLTVEVSGSGVDVAVNRRETMADRFTRIVEEL